MKLAWAALCGGLTSLLLAGAAMAQPNVVVVMTDDQTTKDLRFMPKVKRLAQEGTEFRNAFASYPLCCPSRATFLTGQHAHNTGVMDNGDADELDESET